MVCVRTCTGVIGIVISLLLAASVSAAAVGLERVASGLDRPIFVTHAPGDSERLFIVEKMGAIRILNLGDNSINPTPFLTVPDTDASDNEEGLLGLAFHPDYSNNGKFYINVTVDDGGAGMATRTHIREYTVSANPDIANPTPTEVLFYDQPASNHNGGWMGFSPNDGYLYIMSGDGGGGNDTGSGHTPVTGNAQDTSKLLGKALRIDVDGTDGSTGNYGIPESNPFVGETGRDEIWAYGLRNPWRASFDRQTGDLWIGDVGQSAREEIDFQSADSEGGENYGWRLREGTIATPAIGIGGPAPPGAIDPIYDYGRGSGDFQGGAVVGGYFYRGPDPELQGTYFFADTVSRNIWSMIPGTPPVVDNIEADIPPNVGTLAAPVSFGEDALGNLYMVNLGSSSFQPPLGTGSIYRIVTDATVPGDFNGDGSVDGDDLAAWQLSYGTDASADANDDGESDGRDFLIWQRHVGQTAQDPPLLTGAVAIPEPATFGLLGVGVLCYWWSRRR